MRIHVAWILLLAGPSGVVGSAQGLPDKELFMCAPVCREAVPQLLEVNCDLILNFEAGDGRTLWGPLLNSGPVKIGIAAMRAAPPVVTLPLIVHVRADDGGSNCPPFDDGVFAFQTTGLDTASCESLWVWSSVLELEDLGIPQGSAYWVQLDSQFHPGPIDQNLEGAASSPLRACVWVKAVTVGIEASTWTRLKTVFRD